MIGQIFIILALAVVLALGSSKIGFVLLGIGLLALLILAFGPIGLIFLVLVALVVWFCKNV